MNNETKNELIHTGTIGAVGLGTGMLSAKIGHMVPKIGKSVAAAGAVSGALGLVGDFGAVKLNKKIDMNKKASDNKYLEKIAETYSVKGHDHGGVFGTPNVNLERNQYHQYANDVSDSWAPIVGGLGAGALAAAAGSRFAKARGGKPAVAGAITGLAGYYYGRNAGKNHAHNSALERMGIVHPALLGKDN